MSSWVLFPTAKFSNLHRPALVFDSLIRNHGRPRPSYWSRVTSLHKSPIPQDRTVENRCLLLRRPTEFWPTLLSNSSDYCGREKDASTMDGNRARRGGPGRDWHLNTHARPTPVVRSRATSCGLCPGMCGGRSDPHRPIYHNYRKILNHIKCRLACTGNIIYNILCIIC